MEQKFLDRQFQNVMQRSVSDCYAVTFEDEHRNERRQECDEHPYKDKTEFTVHRSVRTDIQKKNREKGCCCKKDKIQQEYHFKTQVLSYILFNPP